MPQFNFNEVENKIGFTFQNKKLLQQAFYRSSYAHENGVPSNEVLEFIGDKALDLVVIRLMVSDGSKETNKKGFFNCRHNEGELTQMKSEIVNSDNLAKQIDALGLEKYIRYGNNDLKNKNLSKKSIKEDLFEAIIGAATLDSNWDLDEVYHKTIRMFRSAERVIRDAEKDTNYVGQLQEYAHKLGLPDPEYKFEQTTKGGVSGWYVTLTIGDIITTKRFGLSQKDVKKHAAEEQLIYLKQHENEVKKIKQNESIFDRVNRMVQRGEIDQPIYDFDVEYDKNGDPWWVCTATIGDYEIQSTGRSQKKAKELALQALVSKMFSKKRGY